MCIYFSFQLKVRAHVTGTFHFHKSDLFLRNPQCGPSKRYWSKNTLWAQTLSQSQHRVHPETHSFSLHVWAVKIHSAPHFKEVKKVNNTKCFVVTAVKLVYTLQRKPGQQSASSSAEAADVNARGCVCVWACACV